MEGFKLYQGQKFNRISNEQTKLLFDIGTKEAKSEIFEGNLGLVVFVINRYFEYYDDKEELFQSGCVGLWKAILDFDNEKNYEFSTYAKPKIHGEIRRYIRDYSRTIRPNRNVTDILRRIDQEQEHFFKENESLNRLSISELSYLLEVPETLILDALNYKRIYSLEERIGKCIEGYTLYLKDTIPDNNGNFYEDIETNDILEEISKNYTEKQQQIICLYFGIFGVEKKQVEIAQQLGITQPYVTKIVRRFKKDIKQTFNYDENNKLILRK